jgi:hypothetical protein
VAHAECRAQRADLVLRQPREHAVLQRADRVPVLIEQRLAVRGKRDDKPPPVDVVAMPHDQPAGFKNGNHVRHRLGGHERGPGQLCRGHVGMPFKCGERGVLQCGKAGRPDYVVQPGADSKFDLLDQVQRRSPVRAPPRTSWLS